MRDSCCDDHDDPWREVRHTKEAVRARAILLVYTAVVSLPFICLTAAGAHLCGMEPHEVIGLSCYNAMVTSLFFFDTLRNSAHACFDEAMAAGLVACRDGIPSVDAAYPNRRIARLSFAIGGKSAYP